VDGFEEQLVVFTARTAPSEFYKSFVASPIRLDIRRLPPGAVVAIALPPERQTQQNVLKLKRLSADKWRVLVDEIYSQRHSVKDSRVAELIGLTTSGDQSFEATAAKSNMLTIVDMLHDPSSQMLDILMEALRAGKICVIDLSQMRGTQGFVLSGLLLQRIFDRNQDEFTKAEPSTIPVIAVVEEAQSVLGSAGSSAEGPYVTWVKEGRKYDLGAVLVTQQPGSITHELLSQGDNWFVFHLLSAGDLQAVKRANAHFSDDLLSGLLNEPLPGNGVYWSSVEGKSYPIPLRVLSFEKAFRVQDPLNDRSGADTYAMRLRRRFEDLLARSQAQSVAVIAVATREAATLLEREPADSDDGELPTDALGAHVDAAIATFCGDEIRLDSIRSRGMPWAGIKAALLEALPEELDDRDRVAYDNIVPALNAAFGVRGWITEKRPRRSGGPGGDVTWVVVDSSDRASGNGAVVTNEDDIPF
jgi:hypothetical protein